ncbi:mechanosensitive ion channel family protein [Pleionea litopenaei]|uniref:Small-conductance mechanosensitive channel n=1 Tax=Pleionea litopenaei TaxID=3070815 RepID=A0AA51RS44_9GAMM|nr:mechanosensitive ion channel family protein [Pleionea sp. HL-JVS1]WMS86525.1 mechanosensitive ion channel family protein [Pleionea sp. HL-JVS1]
MKNIKPYLEMIAEWLPNPWAQASLWIVAGIVLSMFSTVFFKRLHFWGSSKTQNSFDDLIFESLKSPVRWSIIFASLYFAFQALKLETLWLNLLVSIMITFSVLLWGIFLYKIFHYALKVSAQSNKVNSFVQNRTLPLFENLLLIVSIATGIYFILVVWDINVGPLIASAGILGLAMSLAAKDTMANLFAGVFIMADAPYQIGDYVVLDSGERGKVTHIGIRSTRILTRDDVEVTIPNAIMGNSKIINESSGPHEKYRIRIKIGFAYGSDVSKIREVLTLVAQKNISICRDPEPRVRFRTFGDSALTFELLCWVPHPELRGRISDELNEQVYNAVNEAGLVIPFPQTDVHLYTHNN